MQPNLDPKHPGNVADPYPLYAWLRENDPVHWSESFLGWIITRYDDVHHILRHPEQFSSDRFRKLAEEYVSRRPTVEWVTGVMREWFIFNDPPDHTRVRRLLHNTFTPHDLRRTFAGEMLDAGVDLVTVQKLMGHASPVTTSRYDRRDEKTKMEAATKIHFPMVGI